METHGEDSDRVSCVMHGKGVPEVPDCPVFRALRVVEFLRAIRTGERPASAGFALAEVIVAIALFGTGVLGAVAIGIGGQRMAHIGAARTAQAIAAMSVLEQGGLTSGARSSDVVVDTTRIGARLLELRVTVRDRGPAGPRSWVTRKLADR